jgi:hypothetical protein
MAEFVEKAVQTAIENAVVHGALIATFGLLVAAFSQLAVRLGEHSLIARAGLVAFGTGGLAFVAAALVSGFIVPDFIARYQDRPHEELEVAQHLLGMCRAVNQVCSRVGVTGVAVAILLWSMLLFRHRGATATVGALGCVAGAALTVGLLSGYLRMDVHGMLVVVLVQAAWGLSVSALLIRGRI